jgi:hypothetical protein
MTCSGQAVVPNGRTAGALYFQVSRLGGKSRLFRFSRRAGALGGPGTGKRRGHSHGP